MGTQSSRVEGFEYYMNCFQFFAKWAGYVTSALSAYSSQLMGIYIITAIGIVFDISLLIWTWFKVEYFPFSSYTFLHVIMYRKHLDRTPKEERVGGFTKLALLAISAFWTGLPIANAVILANNDRLTDLGIVMVVLTCVLNIRSFFIVLLLGIVIVIETIVSWLLFVGMVILFCCFYETLPMQFWNTFPLPTSSSPSPMYLIYARFYAWL